MKEYLCHVLGNYELGDPRSAVLMDNASAHMGDEIKKVINDVGAILIYGAHFSPHLNPIEYNFPQYQFCLKRNDKRMLHEWYVVHQDDLNLVNRAMVIKYFHTSKVSGSNLILTIDELYSIYFKL